MYLWLDNSWGERGIVVGATRLTNVCFGDEIELPSSAA